MPRLDIRDAETVRLLGHCRDADSEQLSDLGITHPVGNVLQQPFFLYGSPGILHGCIETGLEQGLLEGLRGDMVLGGETAQGALPVAVPVHDFRKDFGCPVGLGRLACISQYLADYTDVDAMDFRVWRQCSLHLLWRPAEQGNNGNELFFRHL